MRSPGLHVPALVHRAALARRHTVSEAYLMDDPQYVPQDGGRRQSSGIGSDPCRIRRVEQLAQSRSSAPCRSCSWAALSTKRYSRGRLKRAMLSRQRRPAPLIDDLVFRDDEGDHLLAPFGVRPADDRALGDRGVAQQHFLDLARIDVRAAGDDHVLRAVADGEEAVRVQAADVAGVQPAAAQRLRAWPRGSASSPPSRSRSA